METAMLKLCALVRPALLKESPFCLPSLAAPRPSGDRGPKNLALSALGARAHSWGTGIASFPVMSPPRPTTGA